MARDESLRSIVPAGTSVGPHLHRRTSSVHGDPVFPACARKVRRGQKSGQYMFMPGRSSKWSSRSIEPVMVITAALQPHARAIRLRCSKIEGQGPLGTSVCHCAGSGECILGRGNGGGQQRHFKAFAAARGFTSNHSSSSISALCFCTHAGTVCHRSAIAADLSVGADRPVGMRWPGLPPLRGRPSR